MHTEMHAGLHQHLKSNTPQQSPTKPPILTQQIYSRFPTISRSLEPIKQSDERNV